MLTAIARPTLRRLAGAASLLCLALALAVGGSAIAARGGNGGGGGGKGGGGGSDGGGGSKGKAPPTRLEGAGDSIMRGYNADCATNDYLFDFLCYGGADQPEHSFLDGSSSAVNSLLDRYLRVDRKATGGKAASASGSEMRGGSNNFATQASAIVSAATQPVKVVVELGGNDICGRTTADGMYTDAEWQSAVDAGLTTLVNGLPDGSSVLMSGVPRVQDLRAAGIAKEQTTAGVSCQAFWSTYDVCRIATATDANFAAIEERQQRYNEIVAARAAHFNGQAATTGVEVFAEYGDGSGLSLGTATYSPADINGGDCFHPSILGQNTIAEILWTNTPFR